jgi:hypothetical protein
MEFVDNGLGWYTDSTHEQPCLLLDDHVNEVAQLTFCVVVLSSGCQCEE